jgi:hypothetical protein
MNITQPFYDERKRLLIVTHPAKQEHHLRDPVLFLADIVGLHNLLASGVHNTYKEEAPFPNYSSCLL